MPTFTEHELVCEPEEEPESSEQGLLGQLQLGSSDSPSEQDSLDSTLR